MTTPASDTAATAPPEGTDTSSGRDTAFVNEMRLNRRQWLVVAGIVALVIWLTPPVWKMLEQFRTGSDYRIPYSLSKDYWLYQRRLERARGQTNIVVVGDSVIWGEYVARDGTLSHFLSERSGRPFLNGGVNGLFPLALEGLIRYYGGPLHDQKVILHCNLLWLSSPKADLQTEKEEKFNHAGLVPQFFPRIPCYKADINERLGIAIERQFDFFGWVNHLQAASFDQRNFLAWTLQADANDPPGYPNSYRNPLAQITLEVPPEPAADPLRGPHSPRHRPWSERGEGSTRFDWVTLDSSLQWAAFQRLVHLLRDRDNNVLVVVGPFNEHFMSPENRQRFYTLRDGVAGWLDEQNVPHLLPEALPSRLYADASHPLTEGYGLLAERLLQNPGFQQWLNDGAMTGGQ